LVGQSLILFARGRYPGYPDSGHRVEQEGDESEWANTLITNYCSIAKEDRAKLPRADDLKLFDDAISHPAPH